MSGTLNFSRNPSIGSNDPFFSPSFSLSVLTSAEQSLLYVDLECLLEKVFNAEFLEVLQTISPESPNCNKIRDFSFKLSLFLNEDNTKSEVVRHFFLLVLEKMLIPLKDFPQSKMLYEVNQLCIKLLGSLYSTHSVHRLSKCS